MFGRPNWDKIFDDVVAECVPVSAAPWRPNPHSTGTTLETGTSCSAAPARSRWRWRRRAGAPPALFLLARFQRALTRRISNKTTTRAVFNFHGENF